MLGIAIPGSSFLMAVALHPHGQPIAAWCALFPLFVSICVLPTWLAGLAGWLWGAGIYFFAVSGLVLSAHPSTPPGTSTFLWLTVAPAVYAFLASWLTGKIGFSPFVLGVGWMSVELVLARLNLNVGLLGPARPDGEILHWLAQAFGSVFAGFIIAYVNAACVAVVSRVRIPSPRRAFYVVLCDWRRCCETQISAVAGQFIIERCRPRAPPF